jgi:hypothetical protein
MNPRPIIDRVILGLACAGPLLFFGVATAEGFLRAGYDPILQPISALALGPRGWVQQLNFALFAASLFAFAVVLRAQLRPGVASIAGPGVFVLMAIGVALAGIFPIDPPGTEPTLIGRLHLLAGFMVFPWLPVVALLVARRFRRDARFRPLFAYTLATGLFCFATLVFFLLFVGPPELERPLAAVTGLVQRILLLPFLVWTAVLARRAVRAEHPPSTLGQLGAASRELST